MSQVKKPPPGDWKTAFALGVELYKAKSYEAALKAFDNV
jgi:hypothetical protein